MTTEQTIAGLSSGALPSGVAVIRLSGPATREVLVTLAGSLPQPRIATLRALQVPQDGSVLDSGIVLWFPGPASFTGEDCAELHLHGGRAVVARTLDVLCGFEGVRLAEAGEFTRRAFENGRIDLTEVEGLADLISANTEAQRRLAVSQSAGKLRAVYEGWRTDLIRIQALYSAEIDFVDEDDVPEDASVLAGSSLDTLIDSVRKHLDDDRAGEIVRDGFRVAIVGKPNAGKSSLLNVLAKRDAAIVTEIPGTTRDIIDVHLDIAGFEVVLSDTAGLRSSEDIVEMEGVRRSVERAREADLVLWLHEADDAPDPEAVAEFGDVLVITTKDDDGECRSGTSISSLTGHGIDALFERIGGRLARLEGNLEAGLVTRKRHRDCLEACLKALETARESAVTGVELAGEDLRAAGTALGRLAGTIDIEHLLDVVFSEFCVGK